MERKSKDRRRDKKRGETFRSLEKAKITGTGVFSFIGDFIFSGSSPKKDSPEKKKQEKEKMVNEDLAKMIEEKASRPLMSANLRVLVSADSQEKSDNILKEIESAFLQFTEPQGNALKFRGLKGKELDNLFINFLSAFLTKTKP